MGKFQDLTGKRFGRLTVIKRVEDYVSPKGFHITQWLCLCECGNYTTVCANSLKSGVTTSCGCYGLELKKSLGEHKYTKTHGLTNTRLYKTWSDMKARCYYQKNKKYKIYGARGISVCKEWKDNFQNFYNWSMDNGYKDNLTIDRIDVNGNYEPSNCRFVDMKTQQRNRRNNRLVTLNGETRCLVEWCEILGLNYGKVRERMHLGWSPEKALEVIK